MCFSLLGFHFYHLEWFFFFFLSFTTTDSHLKRHTLDFAVRMPLLEDCWIFIGVVYLVCRMDQLPSSLGGC